MRTLAFEIHGRQFAVSEPGTPVTEEAISRTEKIIGTRLPDQLRSYYLRWNGGLPVPLDLRSGSFVCVPLSWRSGSLGASSGAIACLHDMLEIDGTTLDFIQTWQSFSGRLPQGTLCFQRDPGGSLFLIGIAPDNLGRVFFWDRALEADADQGESPDFSNVADVAPSFLDYLLSLRDGHRLAGETDDEWIRRNYGTD